STPLNSSAFGNGDLRLEMLGHSLAYLAFKLIQSFILGSEECIECGVCEPGDKQCEFQPK
ncbi:MAG: hypothetical protein ACTS7I_02810, partial [Candidatus Hodgkinia cicadicola]